MRDSLKAWVQDQDDWKLDYRPKPVKQSIPNRIIKWLENLIFDSWIGFFLIITFFYSLGCWLAGPS